MPHPTRLIAAIFATCLVATSLVGTSLLAGCSSGDQAERADQAAAEQAPSSAGQAWEQAQAQICADMDARDCYFQGMKLEAEGKAERAARYFEAACDKELSSACYDLGVLYETGESLRQDEARAQELYEQACQAADPDATACNNLAVMYQQGRAHEGSERVEDQQRAADLYRRACELGSMLGCRNLARRHLDGNGVEESAQRAVDLLERACKLGHPQACPQLTYLVAHGCVESGECGAEVLDPEGSAEQLREACVEDEEPQACLGHGFMLESGFGDQQPDIAGAALHYNRACEAGVSAGCNFLANLYRRGEGVEQDVDRAVELYEQACDDGFTLACHTLGVMHLQGRSLSPNPDLGYQYIRQACEGGRTPSCTALEFQCYAGQEIACD